MTEGDILHLGREALLLVLLVAGPILAGALISGLLVSILQATTQIQEFTLVFVPKILTVMLVMAIFGPWMLSTVSDFTRALFQMLPNLTR